ncbi:MAG: DinB family protein, partial [Gammaproteobacteria bacterium]
MISPDLLHELRLAQELVTGLLEGMQEESFRRQYHPDLSPLGWHLGHCAYTECYWLQEIAQRDDRFTTPVADLYTPPRTPKPERGKLLPPCEALLQWVRGMQSQNLDSLSDPAAPLHEHPLMKDGYLIHFLIQHHSQHFETMLMVLSQRALHRDPDNFRVGHPITPQAIERDTCHIAA